MKNALVYCIKDNDKFAKFSQMMVNSINSFFYFNPDCIDDTEVVLITDKKIPFVRNNSMCPKAMFKCVNSFHNDYGILGQYYANNGWSIGAFFRYEIFTNPVFDSYGNIIYLDCDTHFCGRISELFDSTFPSSIYLVEEINFNHLKTQGVECERYCNSGVILFRPKKLNPRLKTILVDQLLKSCVERNWKYQDQDALNYVIATNDQIRKHVGYLSSEYNFNPATANCDGIDYATYECGIKIKHYLWNKSKVQPRFLEWQMLQPQQSQHQIQKYNKSGLRNVGSSSSEDGMIFCTVHAGKNLFTNIAVKSILNFHPTVKIFIVDATDPGTWLNEKFSPVDDDIMKNVEVIKGIPSKDENFPILDMKTLNIPHSAKELIYSKVSDGKVSTHIGDVHHTINIQYAIDTINQNFVLMDNDAALIRPANFGHSNLCVCGDLETQKITWSRCFQVIRKEITRVVPFIQYMNVKSMKLKHLVYFNENILSPNMDCAWFIDVDWYTGFLFPTGSLLYKQAINKRIPICRIDHTRYIDHFGAGTWSGRDPSRFYSRYMHMFKNQEPFRK